MGVWTAAAGCTACRSCKEREAPGQQDSSVRSTPGLGQVRFFLVQSHLLPIWLASPAVSLEQWQESSAPSTPKSSPPKVPCARGEPPGQHPWPAPVAGTLPLPQRCHPAREGRGQGCPPAALALQGAGLGWDLQRLCRRNYKGADFPTDASIAALRKCVS